MKFDDTSIIVLYNPGSFFYPRKSDEFHRFTLTYNCQIIEPALDCWAQDDVLARLADFFQNQNQLLDIDVLHIAGLKDFLQGTPRFSAKHGG